MQKLFRSWQKHCYKITSKKCCASCFFLHFKIKNFSTVWLYAKDGLKLYHKSNTIIACSHDNFLSFVESVKMFMLFTNLNTDFQFLNSMFNIFQISNFFFVKNCFGGKSFANKLSKFFMVIENILLCNFLFKIW